MDSCTIEWESLSTLYRLYEFSMTSSSISISPLSIFFSRTFFWKETGECLGKEIFLPENLRLALLGALLVRWLIWAAGIPCSARYSFITWPPFALVKPYLLANCDQLMFASSCHSPASCNSLSWSISRFSILLPWCFFGEFSVWLLSAFLFLVVLSSSP